MADTFWDKAKSFCNSKNSVYLAMFSSLNLFHIQELAMPSLSYVGYILCVPLYCRGAEDRGPGKKWPQITWRAGDTNREWEVRGLRKRMNKTNGSKGESQRGVPALV